MMLPAVMRDCVHGTRSRVLGASSTSTKQPCVHVPSSVVHAPRSITNSGASHASVATSRGRGFSIIVRSKVLQGLDIPVNDDGIPRNDEGRAQLAMLEAAEKAKQESIAKMLRDLYSSRSIPEPFFGPLTLSRIKGKGWGLIATSPIAVGDLIMVSEPLAFVRGPVNKPPEPQQLLEDATQRRYNPTQKVLYELLYRGTERDMTVRAPRLDALVDYGATENAGGLQLDMDPHDLAEVINFNAYGDGNSDLLLSLLRDQEPFSFLGLWPEFSFLNHSCCPNATQTIIGGRMVVRAAREIAPRTEITINYLGPAVLAPLPSREQDLMSWGFQCNCMRCRNERRFEPTLTYMMAEIGEQFMTLQQDYEECRKAPSTEKLEHLEAKLLEMAAQAEEGMQQMAPDAERLMWLRASMFDVFNLLAHVRRMKDPNSEDTLASQAGCVQVIQSVAAGSDFHMLLTCHLIDEVNRVSGGHAGETEEVQRLAFNAVKSRYGPVDEETLQRILCFGAEVVERVNAKGAV